MKREVGFGAEGRDITTQLNYIASQLPGVTRNPRWGSVHAQPLYEAAREIRRLRAALEANDE